MRGYIPSPHRSRAAVCPTEGVKTGAMDLRYVRCLLSSVSTDAAPRGACYAAFSSTAEISRSIAVLSFFLFFFFFLVFSYARPGLGNWPPPRVRAPFVRSFVSSSLFRALRPAARALPHFSRRAHTRRLLILFPVFPLARLHELPRDLLFRFISISAVPVFGAGRYCTSSSPLDFEGANPLYFTSARYLIHMANCASENVLFEYITQKSHT